MNVVQNIESFKPNKKTVLTIGTFDGGAYMTSKNHQKFG